MANLQEITQKELLNLLTDAFAAGVCSYSDLSTSICSEILNKFLESKFSSKSLNVGISTTYSNQTRSDDWNNDQLTNMHTFLSNIIVS